ncbi:MAG: polysaccharide pyruvyl transferase family protein [Oscillospiraceae bacterium]|jgi:coenzyme F420-reducing hydrogenase beta subunit|nr:polysaccharide pyruvyl transferase family protein [Oscillospiraceae bacterium]
MKKVGIATMQGGANYGNVLQNYAVQALIEAAGYTAITLDNRTKRGFRSWATPPKPLYKKLMPSHMAAYRRTRLQNLYGCKNDRDFSGKGLRRAKREAQAYRDALQRRLKKFNDFRASLLHIDTVPIDNLHFDRQHLKTFSAFVCGSDQIWNPHFPTVSMVDFLQFAPEQQRIALAPSFGVSELPPTREKDFAAWISAIPHLSVREEAGAKLIKRLTGREAAVLLDPTFGLPRERWLEFAKKPAQCPTKPYVFCYFLGNKTRRYSRRIAQYAAKQGCEIVDICDIHDLRYYDIDPQEFVYLLSRAQAVFTDSFHGVAFSINLQVPFVAFDRVEGGSSMSSRIATVLHITGLQERTFPRCSDVLSIDFTQAREAISAQRARMIAYLSGALEKTQSAPKAPLLANRYHCSGCAACANACPSEALHMRSDSEGCAYPQIDESRCTRCGACERACPADSTAPQEKTPQAYYAFTKREEICASSSSGGVFTPLALQILRKGGVVFGAGFDENFRVCHMQIADERDLQKLRTSKYVQSEIGQSYKQAKALLAQGVPVLFTGTPCQIAALLRYLGKEYENLYTQDIICHGVPSPRSWERYLSQVHAGKDVQSISFRDKTYGWNDFAMRVTYKDGAAYCQKATADSFVRAFLANLNLRPSCYQCQFKTRSHASDITLADYWGVELVHPELKAQQGVSLVFVHTQKGGAMLEAIRDELVCAETDLERAVGYNTATLHSVAPHAKRGDFFAQLEEKPFAQLVTQCLKLPASKRLRRIVRRNGSRVKRVLKKIKRA